MQKVIVTGGAGFIGSHIVDVLVEGGYEVHIIDNLSSGKEENLNKKALFHNVDIRDTEKITPLFKDVFCVFHEAAMPQVQYSIENPIETHDININGLLSVLEAARINHVKRVVFASSSAIYGNQDVMPITEEMGINATQLSPYGAHKYIGEVYMKLYHTVYGIETVSLRYFNVYGPRQSATGSYASVIPRFIEFKKNGEPMQIVGDGENTRDYIHVTDVACANVQAMISVDVGSGEAVNLGTGKNFSILHIAGLIGGESVHIPPRLEPRNTIANVEKAKKLLHWEPLTELSEGIAHLKEYSNI